MNRRELLATGMGLGSLALTSGSALACCGADEKQKEKDPKLAGPVYCPMYPYMFCGSYTLYYAVQNNGGVCGANPASLAGPNGLTCGCPNGSCQATLKREEVADAKKIVGDPAHAHKALGKLGMKKKPNKKLAFASGANSAGTGVGGEPGYLVSFKDVDGNDRIARVFQIVITASQIDSEMLIELGIDPSLIKDKTFYVGHEDAKAGGEPLDDPAAVGAQDQKRSYRVTAMIDGNSTEFLVVMKRP